MLSSPGYHAQSRKLMDLLKDEGILMQRFNLGGTLN